MSEFAQVIILEPEELEIAGNEIANGMDRWRGTANAMRTTQPPHITPEIAANNIAYAEQRADEYYRLYMRFRLLMHNVLDLKGKRLPEDEMRENVSEYDD